MRILSQIKDYYDYIVSIYGIDNDITFDRRDCRVLGTKYDTFMSIFSYNKSYYYDKKKEVCKGYHYDENNKFVYGKYERGVIYGFILEVGFTHYLFQVERYLDDNDNVIIEPKLIEVKEVDKKLIDDNVISFIPCDLHWSFISKKYDIKRKYINQSIKNPILKETFIPSFIEAEEIYNKIYDYLISIREKPIVDKRDDVQRLESKGFDKKTSFRHPIK